MTDTEPPATEQRWIVVADSPFLPPRGGGEREHLGFLRAAADAGMIAALVIPATGDLAVEDYRLVTGGAPVITVARDHRRRLLVHPATPFVVASRPPPDWLVDELAAQAPDATAVIVFSYKSHAIGRRVAEGLGLPAVLRQHNLEGLYHRALADGTPGPRGWLLRWEARRIDGDERSLENAPWLRAIADISGVDAAVRSRRAAVPVVHVPPFAMARPDARISPRAPRAGSVLFVGALDVATNRDALRWFVERVWPSLRALAPEAVLNVVGRSPTRALIRTLSRVPSLIVNADVDDTAPFLDAASVAVNPTVSGSGVNIKLLEYLEAGVPTVSTSAAAAALGVSAGLHLLVADDPDDFARAVALLLANPADAGRMAANGRAHVRAKAAPALGIGMFADLLRPPDR